MEEFRPASFDAAYKAKYDEATSSEEEDSDDSDDSDKPRKAAAAVDSDDEWNSVAQDR